jgi:hypothetical protein
MQSTPAQASPSGFHQTFRIPTPWRYVAQPLVIMAVTMAIVWIAAPDVAPMVLTLLGAAMLLGLGLGVFGTYRARLEVSETEIVYYGWGYSVGSRWDNLVGYARRPMSIYSVESLILNAPGARFNPILEAGLKVARWTRPRGGPHGMGLSEPDRVGIPVGMFDKDWRSGEIGAIVQRYAPTAYETAL